MTSRVKQIHGKKFFRELSDDYVWSLNRVLKHYSKHCGEPIWDRHSDIDHALASVQYLDKHMLSKYYAPDSGISNADRRQAAIVKWLAVERRNERTNKRLFRENPVFWFNSEDAACGSDGLSAWDIMFRAKSIAHRILGACPPWETLLLKGGFTPGASTSKKRTLDTLARKYTECMDATPECSDLIGSLLSEYEAWTVYGDVSSRRLVKGNILFTVPKNAEIDRVACKEPDLNLWCQKAVGDYIRNRLRRVGINLNDQRVNQDAAREAYRKGYSTIDLSSASDSLTTSLCQALLSPDWFLLLKALRCPKTFIDGYSHVNEMMSSMGNGFTFELESLVFYSISEAIVSLRRDLRLPSGDVPGVFGDDIIVTRNIAPMLISMLGFCGFKTNVDKTFVDGPVFESCGKHYYRGMDVSPFHICEQFTDVSDLILALNQLRSWMIRSSVDLFEHIEEPQYSFRAVWEKFKDYVPRSLHGGWDLELRTSLVTPGAGRARLVPLMREVKEVTESYQVGMYLARLHGCDRLDVYDTPSENERETELFPSRWTGKWAIRRHDDRARFFGIVTNPLFWEN